MHFRRTVVNRKPGVAVRKRSSTVSHERPQRPPEIECTDPRYDAPASAKKTCKRRFLSGLFSLIEFPGCLSDHETRKRHSDGRIRQHHCTA